MMHPICQNIRLMISHPLSILRTCDITGLERYRLTDWSWFDRYYNKLGSEAYWAFTNKVYSTIDGLQLGHKYNLMNISDGNKELFVKIACEYIIDHGGADVCGVEFSNDWKFLLKTK